MNHKQLASRIIEEIGGKENIQQSWHCITRIRFNIVDKELVNIDAIRGLDGVLGAQFKSGQFQVIIGSDVASVFAELTPLLGETRENQPAPAKKLNAVEYIFDVISGIFTPILPAIVGGGLLKGFLALLVSFHIISDTGTNYEILSFIADAPFHFLPFLLAFSAAKKFNTDTSLAIALAGVIMYPQIIAYANGGEIDKLHFLGIAIPMHSYASSVIPVILGVWLLSFVNRTLDKVIPKSLRIIFLPLLTLIITAPIVLAFIAPIGMYIGIYLDTFFSGLFNVAGPVAGLLLGGLMPIIVITGMHYAFFPGAFASFDKYGYDIVLLPMNLAANIAQAGATLGVFFKTKNKKMKQLAFSAFIPAIFGITEPAIYGVTMRLKKPFYASLIGGAVGGAIFGSLTVKAFAFTVPGLMSIPTYLENGTNNFIYALIGVVASFSVAFIVTLLLGFTEEDSETQTEEKSVEPVKPTVPTKPLETQDNTVHIAAPLTGKITALGDVPDMTFSKELVGKGIAILPEDGVVYAPFKGKVTTITPTNHAIGITSDDGVELLIHIGLETVELNGEGFKRLVEQGAEINIGDQLLSFDRDYLNKVGVSLLSPIVVTNTNEFLDIIATNEKEVTAMKENVLMVVK